VLEVRHILRPWVLAAVAVLAVLADMVVLAVLAEMAVLVVLADMVVLVVLAAMDTLVLLAPMWCPVDRWRGPSQHERKTPATRIVLPQVIFPAAGTEEIFVPAEREWDHRLPGVSCRHKWADLDNLLSSKP
jgi:hypothetical protein